MICKAQEVEVVKNMKNKGSKLQRKNTFNGYIMMAPTLIGIAVFIAYPIICSFLYSFQKVSVTDSEWIGLQNYTWMFKDPFFWQSVKNTLFMAILSVITGVIGSFTLASLINSLTKGKKLFKCIFFTPNIVSIVAAATIFKFVFYSTDAGIVNFVLKSMFHLDPVGWFTDSNISRYSIVILNLWKSMGYDTILFIAGLQNISRELYEAAEVDGASSFQRWRYITIPCMKGVTSAIIISYTISSLKRFGDVYAIGGVAGNPGGSLQTLVLYIYRNGWTSNNIGVASAAAVFLFLLALILTLFNFKALSVGKSDQ